MYEIAEIDAVITQVAVTYHQDVSKYLTFTEWRTTTSQHPTMRLFHPLYVPITERHTYSPNLDHSNNNPRPTLMKCITTFRNTVRFQSSSVNTSHLLTPCDITIKKNDIMIILITYYSPLILTIDGSFKPSHTQHIYPPRQSQKLTLVHAAASIIITTINSSYPTK